MNQIRTGDFKHKITIQRKTQTINEDYIPIETWEDLFSTRAKIKNVSGYEAIINSDTVSVNTKRFYIRYSRKYLPTTNDRLIYNNNIYNIIYVSDIEDLNVYYEILCEIVENDSIEEGEDIGNRD